MFSMTSSSSRNFKLSSRRVIVALGVVLLAFTINWQYHRRLPEGFPQAAKYKLICFGVDLSSYLVRISLLSPFKFL